MITIIGLGNPGKEYEKTRHNIGFMVLDKLADEFKVEFKKTEKFNSETAEATITFPGEKKHVRVLLAKPQTFMNNSGEAVSKIANFYKLRTEDQLWVIHDDLDVDLGSIRIRLKGSSAGQKGVQSIIDKLGTDRFARFRVGIRPKEGQDKAAEEFVLEKFKPSEKKIIAEEIDETVKIINESLDKGIIEKSI